MHWLFESKHSPRDIKESIKKTNDEQEEYPPILQENDFKNIIHLEDRYNYYKSLIKVQQLNHMNEQTNEKNMLKVMTELIEYYAKCITEAERNVENIVKYFQYKIKFMNNHYLKVFDHQKNVAQIQQKEPVKQSKQLGNIQIYIQPLKMPEPQSIQEKQDKTQKEQEKLLAKQSSTNDIKTNLNRNIMMALQSQNIEQHLKETHKKADFLKKSIADSIQVQQQLLELRLKKGKKKKNPFNLDTMSNANTVQTNSTSDRPNTLLKRSQSGKISFKSSDSQLDQAQSLYIQNFVMEQQATPKQMKEERKVKEA